MRDAITDALADLRAAHPGYRWPCCTLVARLVDRAYGLRMTPGGTWWAAVNVWARHRPWSGIHALAEQPGGTLVDAPIPGRWHVAQGWTHLDMLGHVDDRSRGHTWLWWALTPTHGLALESSTERGIRWPTGDDCTGEAWADRCAPYAAGVRLVALPPPPERT